MLRFERDVVEAARRVVEDAGGRCRFQRGRGKHGRLEIELNGKLRCTPVSTTPGRPSIALRYKIGDVRRIVRELTIA